MVGWLHFWGKTLYMSAYLVKHLYQHREPGKCLNSASKMFFHSSWLSNTWCSSKKLKRCKCVGWLAWWCLMDYQMSANLIRTLCLILFIIGSAQELLMRQSYLQGQGSRAKPLFGVRYVASFLCNKFLLNRRHEPQFDQKKATLILCTCLIVSLGIEGSQIHHR